LLEYNDPEQGAKDAAAIEFPVGDKKSHFAHAQPMVQVEGGFVNIWYWKGNKVTDMHAKGFKTLKPHDQQDISGKGVWQDGVWRVVFSRKLDHNPALLGKSPPRNNKKKQKKPSKEIKRNRLVFTLSILFPGPWLMTRGTKFIMNDFPNIIIGKRFPSTCRHQPPSGHGRIPGLRFHRKTDPSVLDPPKKIGFLQHGNGRGVFKVGRWGIKTMGLRAFSIQLSSMTGSTVHRKKGPAILNIALCFRNGMLRVKTNLFLFISLLGFFVITGWAFAQEGGVVV